MKFFKWTMLLFLIVAAFLGSASSSPEIAFITEQETNDIIPIDVNSMAEGASIPLEFPSTILAISEDGKNIYIVSEDLCEVFNVNLSSHIAQKLVSLEKELHRCALSKNEKIYISYKKSGALDCLHLGNQQLQPLVTLEKCLHCMVLDQSNDVLYVSYEDSREILALDLNSLKVESFLLLEQVIDGLAITPDGCTILAFHKESDQLTKIHKKTKFAEPSLQIESPKAIGVNHSGTYAYIVKENSNEIIPLNLKKNILEPAENCNRTIQSIGFYPLMGLVASFEVNPGTARHHTLFDASGAGPLREGNTLYAWDFGDGIEAVTEDTSITHIYDAPGEFLAALTVMQNIKNPLSENPIEISAKALKAIEISADDEDLPSRGSLPSTTTGTPSQSTIVIGGSVSDNAVVTGSQAGGPPTGTVTFFVGAQQLGTPVTLNPGTGNTATAASISYTPTAPGNYQFTAAYNGDSSYAASSDSSPGNAFTVTQGTTSTGLTSSVNPTVFGNQTTLTATVGITSGIGTLSGTVTFMNGTATIGTGTLNAGVATINVSNLSVGTHSLTAFYGGNTNFAGSTSAPVTQVVNQGTTSSVLVSSVNPTTYGQSTTFKATVAVATGTGTPTGHFTFMNGATVIGTVNLTGLSASLAVSNLPVGSNSITAMYSGDTNFIASTAPVLAQVVNQATPLITLASSENPSTYGDLVTFTSTVTAPTTLGVPSGTVTFYNGTAAIGTGTLTQTGTNTSTATFQLNTLSGGSHSITAVYSGDTNFVTVTSSALAQSVIFGNTTGIIFSLSPNPSEYGQPIVLQVNIKGSIASPPSGPTGTVTFYDGATVIGTGSLSPVSSNVSSATFTPLSLTIGSHSFSAVYQGDANYNPATTNTIPHTVIMASTSTVTATSVTPSVFGQLVTFTATVTPNNPGVGNPTGTVQFYNGINLLGTGTLSPSGPDASIATIQNSSLALGNHAILAIYLGDSDFSDSVAPLITQVVIQDATTTVLNTNINPSNFGQSITLSATVAANAPGSGTPTGTVTFYDGTTLLGTGTVNAGVATFSTIVLYPGTHALTASYSGDTNYIASVSVPYNQVVIHQLPTVTTIASFRNSSPINQAVTYSATITAITGIPTGTVTFYDNGVAFGTGTINAAGVATVTESGTLLGTLGLHPITAIYTGDANFITSTSAIFDQYVVPYDTSTVLTTTPNHSEQANAVLTATVTATGSPLPIPPFDGTVTFYQNGMAVSPPVAVNPATGVATYEPNDLHFGSTTIIAVYSGDQTTFATSTSNAINQQVQQTDMLTTATTLSSSLSTSYFCESITLTAVVVETQGFYTPTGTVTFFADGNAIGAGILNSSGVAKLAVSTLSIGQHALTATYNSDSNYAFSVSAVITQTVVADPTTTTLALVPNLTSTPYGQTLTFVINVAATYGVPTGVIDLSDESGAIATVDIDSSGLATYVTATLPAGVHTFTATYDPSCCASPSACFQASSSSLNHTITPVDSQLVLSATPSPAQYGNTITLQGTVSSYSVGTPSGTVTFYDGSTLIGSSPIVEGAASIEANDIPAGVNIFNATYSGDSNFISKNFPSIQEVVNKAPVGISLISFSPDPSVFGELVTFSATVTSLISIPTGTVTFFSGTTNLGQATLNSSGVATLQTSALPIGTNAITAVYSGNSNFLAATSSAFSQVVGKSATMTTITSSLPNPSTFNSSITVAVSVAPINPGSGVPTGTVTGSYGSTTLGTATLSGGTASFTTTVLPAGVQTITVVYGGDGNFTGSQGVATHTVNTVTPTVAAIASSANPAVYGQPVTLSTTVSSTAGVPGGTVTFFDGTVQLGIATLSSSGTAAITTSALSVGTHSITVKYSGLGNFAAMTSVALNQVVNKSSTATALSSTLGSSAYGETVTFNAAVASASPGSGFPTGTVTFSNGSTTLGTATLSAGGTASLSIATLVPNTDSITATYSGDGNFNSSVSSSFSLTINQATTITTAISTPNPSASGQLVTLNVTVDSINGDIIPTGVVTATYESQIIGTGSLNPQGSITFTTSSLPVGTLPILIAYAGNADFSPSSTTVTQVVTNASSTITLSSSLNPSFIGNSVIFTATVSSALGNPTGTVTFFDGGTVIGIGAINGGVATTAVSDLALGAHTIIAVYNGDANFAASTSSNLVQNVIAGTTSTTLTSSVNPTTFGEATILTASVNITAGSGVLSGTVTFKDGATVIGISPLSGNMAGLTIANLAVGPHAITATYNNGNTDFGSSTSPILTQNVLQASTTTTLTSSVNPSMLGQNIVLTATIQASSATGMVTFYDGASIIGSGTVSGGVATLNISTLSPGTHPLTASYSGDSNFSPSTSPTLAQIVDEGSTSTTLSSSLNPSFFGNPVTFTATVSSGLGNPTGTVSFFDGGTVIGTGSLNGGVATFATSDLSVGSHNIIAVYNGDANFAASTSSNLVQTVFAGTTSTTLTSSVNPTTFGETTILTASVSINTGPGTLSGTVTFKDGATVIGTSPVSGGIATLAIANLAVGPHNLTATYNGNTDFGSSTSSILIQNVLQSSTQVTLTSSVNPSIYSQNIVLTATTEASSATGTVTFYDGGNIIGSGTVSGGVATVNISTLSAGTHPLTASYSGDSNFSPSTSPTLAQIVEEGTTSTTLSSSLNPSFFGNPVTFTANVAAVIGLGTPTGVVIFKDGNTILGSVPLTAGTALLTTSALEVGTHPVTAIYIGDTNFGGSPSSVVSQIVNPGSTSTSLVSSLNPSNFGETITLSAQVAQTSGSGTLTGFVTFMDGPTVIGTSPLNAGVATLSLSDLAMGTHSLTAVYSGDSHFSPSTSSILTQTVMRASTTTNILSSSPNPSMFGQNVTIFAAVTSTGGMPSGTVTFYDGMTPIGNVPLFDGLAVFATPTLSIGSHLITATYNGDFNFEPSTSSPPVVQVVNQTAITETTITTLTSSLNPSNYGETVTFDITVTPIAGPGQPTGVVTLYSGALALVTLPLDPTGHASYSTATLAAGTTTIVALYSGDSNFSSSTATLAQVVNPIATTTTLSSSVNPSLFGQNVTFNAQVATASGPTATGSVTFFDGATVLGTSNLNNIGSASLNISTLAKGSHVIKAVYNADPNFSTSSDTLTQNVNLAPTVTTILTSAPNPSVQGDLVTFTANTTATTGIPTGTLTFYDGATIIGTAPLESGFAIFATATLTPGSHSITASYASDGNFASSVSLPYIQIVNQGILATTTTISSSLNPAQLGSAVTFTATVSSSIGIPTGTVTFFDGPLALGTSLLNLGTAELTTSSLTLGDHSITAVYNGSAAYSPSRSLPLVEVIIASVIPGAPQNFYGYQVLNHFINDKVRVNILNWTPPQDSGDVATFEIYRDAALTQLVGRVCNKFPFKLEDANRKKNVVYTYYIVSVTQGGIRSPAASASVKPLEKCKD